MWSEWISSLTRMVKHEKEMDSEGWKSGFEIGWWRSKNPRITTATGSNIGHFSLITFNLQCLKMFLSTFEVSVMKFVRGVC